MLRFRVSLLLADAWFPRKRGYSEAIHAERHDAAQILAQAGMSRVRLQKDDEATASPRKRGCSDPAA